jgi:AAA+ ATPase superfamily predicted ATPase
MQVDYKIPDMNKLIDREKEAEALRKVFKAKSSLSLVYGQRRTGKTFLLQHVLEGNANTVFFIADETTSPTLLKRFAGEISSNGGRIAGIEPAGGAEAGWSAALTMLIQGAGLAGNPIFLVFDEFQYLLNAEPAITSIIQRLWDQFKEKVNLHIVLCGSSLGIMSCLGDGGEPLYGRFSLKLKLKPFDYLQASRFSPGWSVKNMLLTYGIFGGLARHLAELDPSCGLAENVEEKILDPLGPLNDSAGDLIRSERISSRPDAGAVLAAVSSGESSFNMVASMTGLTSTRLDFVFKELLALEIVRRETRFGDKPGSRYSRYLAADPMVAFYNRFVVPNRAAILSSDPATVWRDRIEPGLNDYMGAIFEDVVRQAVTGGVLIDVTGPVDESSSYWSRDGATQIDLVSRSGETLCLFECKWSSTSPTGISALRQLRDHASRFPSMPGTKVKLCLASSLGFAKDLHELEKLDEVALVGPEKLFPE